MPTLLIRLEGRAIWGLSSRFWERGTARPTRVVLWIIAATMGRDRSMPLDDRRYKNERKVEQEGVIRKDSYPLDVPRRTIIK